MEMEVEWRYRMGSGTSERSAVGNVRECECVCSNRKWTLETAISSRRETGTPHCCNVVTYRPSATLTLSRADGSREPPSTLGYGFVLFWGCSLFLSGQIYLQMVSFRFFFLFCFAFFLLPSFHTCHHQPRVDMQQSSHQSEQRNLASIGSSTWNKKEQRA